MCRGQPGERQRGGLCGVGPPTRRGYGARLRGRAAAPEDPGGGPPGAQLRGGARARDVRFGRAGTVSFESLWSKFDQKSSKFCSHSVGIHQKSKNLTSSQNSPRNLVKFRENFMKIGAKFDENHRKIVIFDRKSIKDTKVFDEILLRF